VAVAVLRPAVAVARPVAVVDPMVVVAVAAGWTTSKTFPEAGRTR
jgi:hypothetical protein